MSLCRAAGRIVVLGLFSDISTLNAFKLMNKELVIRGSNTYGMHHGESEFRSAVDLLPLYQAELQPLLTHQFPLESLADAFRCAEDKSSGAIKVTVTIP